MALESVIGKRTSVVPENRSTVRLINDWTSAKNYMDTLKFHHSVPVKGSDVLDLYGARAVMKLTFGRTSLYVLTDGIDCSPVLEAKEFPQKVKKNTSTADKLMKPDITYNIVVFANAKLTDVRELPLNERTKIPVPPAFLEFCTLGYECGVTQRYLAIQDPMEAIAAIGIIGNSNQRGLGKDENGLSRYSTEPNAENSRAWKSGEMKYHSFVRLTKISIKVPDSFGLFDAGVKLA